MTPIWGLTDKGIKKTGRDISVLPRTVIYDPLLTLALPPSVSGTSGINSIAHCVEALYSETANPVTSLMAEEGIRALASSLPRIVRDPGDLDARTSALYGAWLGGSALAAVGMAIHHKLCHTLGGTLNLPHAETHTIVLPHAAAFNRDAAPEAMARVARALGVDGCSQRIVRSGGGGRGEDGAEGHRNEGGGHRPYRRPRPGEPLLQSPSGHAGEYSGSACRCLSWPEAMRTKMPPMPLISNDWPHS